MTRARLGLVFLLVASCAEPHDSAREIARVETPPALDEHVAALAPPLDAAATADAGAVVPSSESCAPCHAGIAAEWASSRHHTSFDDPVFLAEWGADRDPWCVGCHAPLAEDADDTRVHEGVGCASCHVVEGVIVSDAVSGRARHETRVDPTLATEQLCARCHQFAFPHAPEIAMQDTVAEWRASGTERTCIDCHGREARGGFSHAFPGMRDPTLLARAVAIEPRVERTARGTRLTLRLRSRAGHAVPTGDLFRRLRVSAWIEGAPRSLRSAVLSRELAMVPGEGRLPTADQRLPPRFARELVLDLPRADGAVRVRYRIDLEALDPRDAERRGLREADVRQRVATGSVSLADVAP